MPHIIFDFDGTLMDTAPVILATMRATLHELSLPSLPDDVLRSTIGLRLEDIPAVLWPGCGVPAEVYAATYRRLFPQHNRPGVVTPFPHVLPTLHALAERGAQMAIASSRSRASLTDFLDAYALAPLFCQLVGGEDVLHGKPAPDAVRLILSRQGWAPSATLMVGDAPVDIQMGRAAGVRTCAVTYGNATRHALEAAAPDALIGDFREVLRI